MPIHTITPELVAEIVSTYSSLERLNLSRNEIEVIENLEALGHSLKTLNLSENRLRSSGLNGLDELPNLTSLDLSNNEM